VFASEIIDQNAVAIAEGRQPIPLRSILIGNGFTDMSTMQLSYYDMQCTNVSVPPVLSIATCVAMKAAVCFLISIIVLLFSHYFFSF
jgi:cathepsin A (carboxypeptidase C)